MKILKDFRNKEFLEQIGVLQEVENHRLHEAIDSLCELVAEPLNDDSVDFMIKETLQKLLSENETKTAEALRSESPILRKLCIRTVMEKGFKSAGSALAELADKETSTDMTHEILGALAQLQMPEHVDIFRRHIMHPDQMISSLAITMIGSYRDRRSLPDLFKRIESSNCDENFPICSIVTYKAIEALGAFEDESSLEFLVSTMHHRNPSARRIIQEKIVQRGSKALPQIARFFGSHDTSSKIFAANVIGNIGDPAGADILITELEKQAPLDKDLQYAIFDALGKIPTQDATRHLLNSLSSEDELLLMSALAALDRQVSQEIVDAIAEIANSGGPQARRIISALALSKSLSLFSALYKDADLGNALIDSISQLNDSDVIAEFYMVIQLLDDSRAERDAARLENCFIQDTEKIILAVHDSKTMLNFYRKVAADLGMDIITENRAVDALAHLKKKSVKLNLIIYDLDMPGMDGVEFARFLKDELKHIDIPVLASTIEPESILGPLLKNANINDFIRMPFTPADIKKKIKAMIG